MHNLSSHRRYVPILPENTLKGGFQPDVAHATHETHATQPRCLRCVRCVRPETGLQTGETFLPHARSVRFKWFREISSTRYIYTLMRRSVHDTRWLLRRRDAMVVVSRKARNTFGFRRDGTTRVRITEFPEVRRQMAQCCRKSPALRSHTTTALSSRHEYRSTIASRKWLRKPAYKYVCVKWT